MSRGERMYVAIDLKSFYASVECVDRGLDPLNTNLVVADESRTEKTICLAVSPSLKRYGISGRARLFEVLQRVKEVNQERKRNCPNREFSGKSCYADELDRNHSLELAYLVAPPRMARYIEVSIGIYEIYLKYIAPEDIHVYSVDEVFMDVTDYLNTYKMSARDLTAKMIRDVRETTGITATAGVADNMYLCKVAMDIVAKHMPADEEGVRIAELDERSYRELLWTHEPITDFWRVGKGYSRRLKEHGLYTMGDIARCSIGSAREYHNEDLLYRLFGVNAELLIDHAWGWEPCTIDEIKAYSPQNNSISSGQVLKCPYDYKKAEIIVREMTELLVLDLVDKELVTDQLILTVGYDIENLKDKERSDRYSGAVSVDHYGRKVPKHARGTENLNCPTSSTKEITKAALRLYERITDKTLLVRRINITANHVVSEKNVAAGQSYEQLQLFVDYEKEEQKREAEKRERQKEKSLQKALLTIRKRYGKNAILKGTSLQEGAMTIERNGQIGGHKA